MYGPRILSMLLVAGVLAFGASVCKAEAADEIGLRHSSGVTSGIRRYVPGKWTVVATNVSNFTDQPVEVLVTSHFGDDPNLQYARHVWVPAKAQRSTWYPILTPASIDLEAKNTELSSLLFGRSGKAETPLRNSQGEMTQSRLISIHRPTITGVISAVDDDPEDDPDDAGKDSDDKSEASVHAAIAVMKESMRSPLTFCTLFEDFLPPVQESLQGLDQLVICNDRLASDAAGLTAVRHWLQAGGRVWIMLDRVAPETLELLLNDSFKCQVVDRVGLNQVLIEDAQPLSLIGPNDAREFEKPVDFVRVLVSDVEMIHTVNGWPASFSRRVANGYVLFTTLGAEGWMRPRTRWEPQLDIPFSSLNRAATQQLSFLAGEFLQPAEPPMLKAEDLQPYLTQRIGYKVAGRGSVFGILGSFCGLLVLAAVCLARRQQLERMIWVAPVAALVTAGTLIVIGMWTKQAVPPTVAVAQLVEVEPGAEDIQMTGLMAIYNQEASSTPIGAKRGGLFDLDMSGLAGATRRMVRTDMGAWHWENLTLPSGVSTASFQHAAKIDHPVEVRGTFSEAGFTGTLSPGPFENVGDALIALPSARNLGIRLDEEGNFTAGAGQTLASGQFLTGNILSDEQRRRQSIYRNLLPEGAPEKCPARPVVFAWADAFDMQFICSEQAKLVGSALLAIPLEIERPPAGTRLTIPSPCLAFRAVGGPLKHPSAAYTNHRKEWVEVRDASQAWLRFQVPPEILPVELDSAVLTIEINAPARKVSVLGLSSGKPVDLITRNGPVGSMRCEVQRADLLELDDRGGLLLGIDVGKGQSMLPDSDPLASRGSLWKIEDVKVEVSGMTLEPTR